MYVFRCVFFAVSSVGNQLEKCFFDKSWDTGPVPPEGESRVSRRPAFLGVASTITVSTQVSFCKSRGFNFLLCHTGWSVSSRTILLELEFASIMI